MARRDGAARRQRRQPQRDDVVRLSTHPRAARQIRLAKGWGGLAGFAIVALASASAGIAPADVALRALGGGVIAYLAVWACAVYAWRQVAVAEVRAEWERRSAERERALEDTLVATPGSDSEEAAVGGPSQAGVR